MTYRDIAKKLVLAGHEDLAKAVLVLAAPLQILNTEISSFPEDDFDDEAVADVLITFVINEDGISKLFKKQHRVLPDFLKTLTDKEALRALYGSTEILKQITPAVKKAVLWEYTDKFNRGIKKSTVDFSTSQDTNSAKINPQSIEYTLEVSVLFDFGEEPA